MIAALYYTCVLLQAMCFIIKIKLLSARVEKEPLFTEDISNFLNRNSRQVFSRLQSRLSSG